MAETVTITTQPRTDTGSRAARKLRERGLIPAVVYGHKQDTLAVVAPAEALDRAIKLGARVVDIQAGGVTEKARIRDLQWDHLGKSILHVDFLRVSEDERIDIRVRVELRGIAPGASEGGVLDQPLHDLEIECLAIRIPDVIRVDVSGLHLGQSIHVEDLKLPEGVVAKADAKAIVVHVTAQKAEPEPTEAVETGGAEPEVITAKKETAEDEE